MTLQGSVIKVLLAERDSAGQQLERAYEALALIATKAKCPIEGLVVSKHGAKFCAKHIALNALADLDRSAVESATKPETSGSVSGGG